MSYVSVDGSGNVSNVPPSHQRLAEANPDAPAPSAPAPMRGRVTVQNMPDGSVSVTEHKPGGLRTGLPATSSDDVLSTGRNAFGHVERGAIDDETILDHPALGGSAQVKTLVAMGAIVKDANGYRFVGFDGEQPQKKDETPVEEKKDEKDPDVLSLSTESEAALADIASRADGATMGAVFEAVATGSESIESALEALASKSGLDREVVSSRIETIHQNLIEQFNARTGLSEDQRQAFGLWAHQHAPSEIMEAMSAHAGTGSLKGYGPLLAKWQAAGSPSASASPSTPQTLDEAVANAPLTFQAVDRLSPDEIQAAVTGNGVTLSRKGGNWYVTGPDFACSLRDAIRGGFVTVRRG